MEASNHSSACSHPILSFASSKHVNATRYKRPNAQQRAKAADEVTSKDSEWDLPFPAPLVLPGDELSYDPYGPQSLSSWAREKQRNEVTKRRNVIYVVSKPKITTDISSVRDWSVPQTGVNPEEVLTKPPCVADVAEYLKAFYHGLQVKVLPSDTLRFAKWDIRQTKQTKAKPQLIGLNTATESIGIRWRPSPDGIFSGQLNLDDLLDLAISMLPEDAYALLMLVEHDLYEDEDDDFCCGRAYGGSRVAVVSQARYNPCLDEVQNVEREHAWPASHCMSYMQSYCTSAAKPSRTKAKTARAAVSDRPHAIDSAKSPDYAVPLQSAVAAQKMVMSKKPSSMHERLAGHWLSRLCQTANHELGHCFGLDHCTYYACVMQGTSSLAEDVRQPPYLCPVDLAKVLRATSANRAERYEALKNFCDRHRNVPMLAAFGAWLGSRLESLILSSSRGSGSKDSPIQL